MRKAVWNSMLDANMNVRYWKYLTQRYSIRERVLKILLAITSSGTVAGWTIWSKVPELWQSLSSLSALIAIALPILNYPKLIETMADLSGKWWEVKREYEDYWISLEAGESFDSISPRYNKTKSKEDVLVKTESRLPYDEKLLRKCQEEVLRSRGLEK